MSSEAVPRCGSLDISTHYCAKEGHSSHCRKHYSQCEQSNGESGRAGGAGGRMSGFHNYYGE